MMQLEMKEKVDTRDLRALFPFSHRRKEDIISFTRAHAKCSARGRTELRPWRARSPFQLHGGAGADAPYLNTGAFKFEIFISVFEPELTSSRDYLFLETTRLDR
jgi:hypothetical protein